ncbi:MAG TPA: leucyl aminopeptidase [Desulfobulbaceae bacterium]|nr:leucyl aminopeptidase [Desulfobulbaceae bacterium]
MISRTARDPEKTRVDLLVCFAAQVEGKIPAGQGGQVSAMVRQAWQVGDFSGKVEETLFWYPPRPARAKVQGIEAQRVLVVGCGKVEEEPAKQREQLRLAAGTAASRARKVKAGSVLAVLPAFTTLAADEVAECVAEGLLLGNYLFARYKQKKGDEDQHVPVQQFLLQDGGLPPARVKAGMERGRRSALAVCAARDMANEPANYWNPARFAEYGRRISGQGDLKCTVLGKAAMKRLGMGGILAVNQGSAEPAAMVILEYRSPGKGCPTLLLVGKGLTFDSGGVSHKPAAGMEDMKYDMCGGAAVLAAMQAVAEEGPRGLNVVALVPATDNMAGAAALKPGDIITQYGGRTVEVVNTDAEGRLLLADALAYGIEKFKPAAVVDVATLTGAVIVGLGHHRTGLLANNDVLAAQILVAGEQSGEPLWRLPLGPEYTRLLKSEVADLKNVGDKSAGTITAAAFLQEFVGETPWAHLDIAGTAWGLEKSYINGKGPTGTAVRTLLQLIRNWQPQDRRCPSAKN